VGEAWNETSIYPPNLIGTYSPNFNISQVFWPGREGFVYEMSVNYVSGPLPLLSCGQGSCPWGMGGEEAWCNEGALDLSELFHLNILLNVLR